MEGGGGEREGKARQTATEIPPETMADSDEAARDGTRGGQRREGGVWPARMALPSLSLVSETVDGDVSSTSDWPRLLGRMSCHERWPSLSR